MKKLMFLVAVATVSLSVLAEEAVKKADAPQANVREESVQESSIWPASFSVGNYPRAYDVVGLRLTIPFSTIQESVTGLDLGFWGSSFYYEGVQVNILRNEVKDDFAGVQAGIYNSAGNADWFAVQVGLWNEAETICGVQVGLVNLCGEGQGFQVGAINRASTLGGYQVGFINVIRDAELKFFPIVNIGF